MSKKLLTIFENLDESFYVSFNNKKYTLKDINAKVEILQNSLKSVDNFTNKYVFIDIRNRLLFILLFIALLKENSHIIIVPIEIEPHDYITNDKIFISDNKLYNEGLYINKNLHITIGDNYTTNKKVTQTENPLSLYTSGSTGQSKLIPKSSTNILSELEELKNNFKITNSDLFFATVPLYHIYGILFGLLLPVYCSASIIIDDLFTPETIVDVVSKGNITRFVSIPSYYSMFDKIGAINNFTNCKTLFTSSAPLPANISKNFYEKNIAITEIYGSTETGGIAYRTNAIDSNWKLFSYVKLILDWDLYISEGIENNYKELRIVSPTISVNYDHELGFNTGDLVIFSSKQHFKLAGRNTRFVKISGKRVDLNFVHDKIKTYLEKQFEKKINNDALYICEKNEKIIVISEIDFPKTSAEMKQELKDFIPGYAIPRYYINNKIPRNSMSKYNKKEINKIVDEFIKNI